MNTKSQNPLISLFGISTKTIFLLSTTLTLLLYSACDSNKASEPEPLMVTYDATTKAITGLNPDLPAGDVNLVIPANIDGVAIDSIRHGAFYNNTRIVSLRIAEGIKHIGDSAFLAYDGNQQNPTSTSRISGELVIPNSVETIGFVAFALCEGFTGSLTLGSSLETIGNLAFRGCSGFTGDLTIGSSVETIGFAAFEECSGFTGSLTIPNSVKTIGSRAFQECTGFTGSLTLGSSVDIGESVFSDCSGFTGNLTIPSSVDTIGNWAFDGMINIDAFIFESSEPPYIWGGSSLGIFNRIPIGDLNIIVPADAVEAYRTDDGFSQYSARIKAAE